MEKGKCTYDELICHLEEKGVTFNIINKEVAKEFLKDSCYYFKLASYRENYDKNKVGKYVNLDFAYLVELSKIDRDLRYIIMTLCLDIEHELRVRLVDSVVSLSDGIEPVQAFIDSDLTNKEEKRSMREIQDHKSPYYNKELIEKFEPNFPIWVFIEVISFGTLCRFINFFQEKYKCKIIDVSLLTRVRILRNAVAHNNCLLRNLRATNKTTYGKVNNLVLDACKDIKPEQRNRRLKNQFISDFVCLLFIHHKFVKGEKKLVKLKELVYEDIPKHKKYFEKNQLLLSNYCFIRKLIDNLLIK